MSEGDIEGAAALTAEDLVNHAAIPEAQGRAGLVRIFQKLRTAFPDLRFSVEDVIGEDDRVVVRGRMSGTHTGPFDMVRFQLPATGKAVDVEHLHVFRIAGGRIAEHWAGRDDIAFQRQLGLAPKPV
jgi:steroid delta-isomerase-like uncharacterized protein